MEIDYSFMNIGGLHQDSAEIMQELCRRFGRFGAEKAISVYCTAMDCFRENLKADQTRLTILNECGVKITPEDMGFLGNMILGVLFIQDARSAFKNALKKK